MMMFYNTIAARICTHRAAAAVSAISRRSLSTLEEKGELVSNILAAKEKSGKTYDEIAKAMGYTNAYTAQLFLNQAQLKADKAKLLKKTVPALTDEDLKQMTKCPYRAFDDAINEEPLVYRLHEAVSHYGEGLKQIVNEKFGDGIMSAIDVYVTVDKVKGKSDEDRVVITFNGKYLPHIEQKAADNTAVKPSR